MRAPIQATLAFGLAVAGIPLLVYASTRVGRGQPGLHRALMLSFVVIEAAVFASFGFLEQASPRRAELVALPLFKLHLAFAIGAILGQAWQLASRAVPRVRPVHRQTGPYVVLLWCLALLTGMYNYVFLYLM